MNKEIPSIAITMGDPCGIGPEVVVKALSDPNVYDICRPLVVGNIFAMNQAIRVTDLPVTINSISDPKSSILAPRIQKVPIISWVRICT